MHRVETQIRYAMEIKTIIAVSKSTAFIDPGTISSKIYDSKDSM